MSTSTIAALSTNAFSLAKSVDASTIHAGHCLDIEHLAGRFYSLTVYASDENDTAHTLAGVFRSFLQWSQFATVASGGKWTNGAYIARTYIVVR
jgi:hypothetical protein